MLRNTVQFLFQNKIFKYTVVYTFTDGLSKGISFLIFPLVSYYILPDQLGLAANFDVLQLITSLLAGMAVVNSLPYFFYEQEKKENALMISNLILIVLCICLFFSVIIFFFSNVIYKYLQIDLSLQLLALLAACANLFFSLGMIILRLEDKVRNFVVLSLSQVVVQLLLVSYFVLFCKMQALGKIYSSVITQFLFALIQLSILYKRGYIVTQFSASFCVKLLKFGLPLLPHSLSFWFKSGIDKILLTNFCGLSVNGLYSMALSLGGVYNIFNQSFNNAYIPYLQKKINNVVNLNVEKRRIVALTYKLMLLFTVVYFIAVIIAWGILNYLLSEKYIGAFMFIPWIMLVSLINTMYGLVIQFIYTSKKTFGLGVITFSFSIFQAILGYVLVRQLGAFGICLSSVIGAFLIAISVWGYSMKVYPMPWFNLFIRK